MAKDFTGFSSENLTRMLAEWGADQREREVWKDRDQSTYRYRANLLEASSQRIAALTAQLEVLRRDAAELADDFQGCGDHTRHKQAAEAWHYCAKKLRALVPVSVKEG